MSELEILLKENILLKKELKESEAIIVSLEAEIKRMREQLDQMSIRFLCPNMNIKFYVDNCLEK